MGVSQRRVSAIESGDLTHSQIGTLHAYIAALGGHITINAEFDEQTNRIASAQPGQHTQRTPRHPDHGGRPPSRTHRAMVGRPCPTRG